jgi:predicted permease
MRGLTFIDHRIHDLRFAVRQLVKHRGFAATAILVLALGIAANVAIFAFVDAAIVKPLPYTDPSRLITVFGARPQDASARIRGSVSYLDFLDWRSRNRAFSAIAAYDVRAGFTLSTPGGPQRVSGLRVTAGFFRTLGVEPVLGREFNREEEGASAPATVMVAYRTWQSRFGGRPDVLGLTVTLQSPWLAEGEPHVVIGVLPQAFHFPMAEHAEFWATIRRRQACWDARSCRSLESIARLADGVSVPAAAASITSVLEQLRTDDPDHHREQEVAKLVPLREVVLGDVRPILFMLLSGAALLLLISCINVVSLLLIRSDSRTRETAVRHALGASSTRLVLQSATEALVLVTMSSVLGLMLSAWGMRFLTNLLSAEMISRMPYLRAVGLNFRVAAFGCAISLIAAVVFALAPLARSSVSDKLAGLKDGSRGSSSPTWRRFGAHLVVAELAIAVTLLVSAALLAKSLYRLLHVQTGFNTERLTTLSVSQTSVRPVSSPASGDARGDNATGEHLGDLARQVADRVAALPGIQAVGYADLLPLGAGLAPSSTFWVMGRPIEGQLADDWPVRRISAGYFRALQATLLRGRYFTDGEVASMRLVMIINETAARRYFAGEDPIGRRIAFGGPASAAREIVGIVSDIKDGPPESPPIPAAYVPFDRIDFGLVVRASRTDESPLPSFAAAIREVRPGLLVSGETSMMERLNRLPPTSLRRSSAWLAGGFAAIAFSLSVFGLYGVVAYSVSQRRREIGVRMALGARSQSVQQLVVGEAAWLVALGTALGMICAVAAATLMRRMMFGVHGWDVPTLVTVAAVFMSSALLASYIPARRAASVNPIEVLRHE